MMFIQSLTILLATAEAKFGYPCITSYNCNDHINKYLYTFSRKYEKCSDGRCLCVNKGDFQYTIAGESTCRQKGYIPFCINYDISDNITTSICPKRQKCIRSKCKCESEDLFKIRNNCYPRELIQPLGKCNVTDGFIYACDDMNDSTSCLAGECHCISTHFYNFSSMECETKKSYTKLHDIWEYKALPWDYCLDNSDCITGLECSHNICDCPLECSLQEEQSVCDCGEAELEIPKEVIISGVVCGLFFTICWCCILRKTIQKHVKKFETVDMRELTCQDEDDARSVSHGNPSTDQPPAYSSLFLTVSQSRDQTPTESDTNATTGQANNSDSPSTPIIEKPTPMSTSEASTIISNPTTPVAPVDSSTPDGPLGFTPSSSHTDSSKQAISASMQQ